MPTYQLYMTNAGLLDGIRTATGIIQAVGLYQNHAALSKGFDPSTLVEADFSGYSRLDVGSWLEPVIDANGNATYTHLTELTWTKSGATANAEVWGIFFILKIPFTILLGQEFAAAPYPMVNDGDLIRFLPVYSVSNPIFP